MQSLEEQLQHGGGVSLSFSGNFYNGYFDTAKTKFNTLGIKWRYREAGSSTWSAWTSLVLNTGFKYGTGNTYFSGNGTSSQEISLGTGFNYKKNYVFELCYNDKLSSVTYSQTVKEGEPCFDYGKDKDGNNYLNVNGDIYKNNKNISDLSDTGWTDLTLNTNWANLGGNYPNAQYKKIRNQVFLRGLVKNTTNNTNLVIATLPSGYRPSKYIMYSMANMSDTFLSCYVDTRGQLRIANYTKGNWIDLSGFSFFID